LQKHEAPLHQLPGSGQRFDLCACAVKRFALTHCCGHRLRIEYQWFGQFRPGAPTIVFLHEGLGSISMWRDFPARLCEQTGCAGLAYSRPGYGQSSPHPQEGVWGVDFLHKEALEVLPAFLQSVGVDATRDPLLLFGHSDGGSMALIFAAHFSGLLRAAIVLAPHIFVEQIALGSIAKAADDFQCGALRARLARHHANPDRMFRSWSQAWLDPALRAWSIKEELAGIRCALLAIQGLDDEYGTLEQVRRIACKVPGTRVLELAGCSHSPHRDQPALVLEASLSFVRKHLG
jgi:pimeloyl-ACP methyl ester carboxylesterase